METITAKIVVVGAQGVGKTCLVGRYSSHTFSPHTSATVGAAFTSITTTAHGYDVQLQVWDTAGQERYKALAPLYYRGANAAIVVYDVTNADTFSDAQYWTRELQNNVTDPLVMVVLGNKLDLLDSGPPESRLQRKISRQVATEFAAQIGAVFFEASALTNDGVDAAFDHIALVLAKAAREAQKHGKTAQVKTSIVVSGQPAHSRSCC